MVAGPLIPHQFGQRDDLKTKETAAACERLERSGKLLFIRGFCGFHYYSAAYSGLQECERFSARLPRGQQSSAAFLELGGNAMICRDTPQILQTTRCTHVGCMCCVQCSADLPRSDGSDPRQSGLGILDGPPTSLEPPSSQGGRDFTKQPSSICHFATLPLQRISSRM